MRHNPAGRQSNQMGENSGPSGLPLFDAAAPTPNTHRDRDFSKGKLADTSRETFRRTSDQTRAEQRRKILTAIAEAGAEGRTCEELADELGIRYTSASGRISELRHAGAITYGDQRRQTSAGRSARVYFSTARRNA